MSRGVTFPSSSVCTRSPLIMIQSMDGSAMNTDIPSSLLRALKTSIPLLSKLETIARMLLPRAVSAGSS
ncbi:MAG TPA: hypothetical protein VEG44_01590 [Candidatus Acidoferrales bacterium]|nr:hypothetical protein [Candidatus Acidoferrales bacterium]